jgi:hypothetical protein
MGRGGLGYGGVQVLEQRLDVTGHAISALTKVVFVLLQDESSITINKGASRDMNSLSSWAQSQGVSFDNAIFVQPDQDRSTSSDDATNTDDWTLILARNATAASPLLKIPSHLVLSSERIQKELGTTADDARAFLILSNVELQVPQFYLFVKFLIEYCEGDGSRWKPWIQSMPRSFDTAICMDDVEMECLPPFAWALASVERYHFHVFCKALKRLPTSLFSNKEILDDEETLRWIFNCVFTRCWRYPDPSEDGEERCDMVPLGDMFNHNAKQTIEVDYDDDGSVSFSLRYDSLEGSPLYLSYGMPTNPHRFLVAYGFVDESLPEIFCQILSNEPSQKLVNMGYDSTKMVFRTTDGAIANAVWDVMMYNLLEQVPEIQESFYQAHMSEDHATKAAIHGKFHLEATLLLRNHVHKSLQECQELLHSATNLDDSEHPRLPLIRRHLNFLSDTFTKVQNNLDGIIRRETKARLRNT